MGTIERRPHHSKADLQVLPLGMERTVVAKLDAAVRASGVKNRSTFIRNAIVAYLRNQEGAEATAAVNAIGAGEY